MISQEQRFCYELMIVSTYRSQDDQEAIRRKGSMEIDMSSPFLSEQKVEASSGENGRRTLNNQRKQRRHEKLDWNVLKRPKVQDKEDAT